MIGIVTKKTPREFSSDNSAYVVRFESKYSERLFRKHVQAGEQPQSCINVVVVDVTQTLLSQEFQREQAEQRRVGGNPLRPRIVRLAN